MSEDIIELAEALKAAREELAENAGVIKALRRQRDVAENRVAFLERALRNAETFAEAARVDPEDAIEVDLAYGFGDGAGG